MNNVFVRERYVKRVIYVRPEPRNGVPGQLTLVHQVQLTNANQGITYCTTIFLTFCGTQALRGTDIFALQGSIP